MTNYHTKSEDDAKFLTKTAIDDYYTDDEVDSLVDDFITKGVTNLDNYYDDDKVDGLIEDFITRGVTNLTNYYDDDKVDELIDDFITKGVTNLTEYYTKTEVDAELEDVITKGVTNLDNYYDNDKVDELIDDFVTEGVTNLVNYISSDGITEYVSTATDGLLNPESLEDFAEDDLFDYITTYFTENPSREITVTIDSDNQKIRFDFQTSFNNSVSDIVSKISALEKAVTNLQQS